MSETDGGAALGTGGHLVAQECPDLRECLDDPPRLWVVRIGHHDDPVHGLGPDKEDLVRDRYRTGQVWHPPGFTVALLLGGQR